MDGLHALKKLSRRLVGSKELREAAKSALGRVNAASGADASESDAPPSGEGSS